MKRPKPKMVIYVLRTSNCNLERLCSPGGGAEVPWNGPPERVTAPYVVPQPNEQVFEESGCFVLQPQAGDKLLLRLNICGKPIANKYCEGKMKSTLERESKDLKPLRRKRKR